MSVTVSVSSRAKWVATSVKVLPGDELSFQSIGIWIDAVIPCSADGYDGAWLYALDRPPRINDNGRYFRLMGRIITGDIEPQSDNPDETFVIGKHGQYRAAWGGSLFVFVNDRDGYYWNNWGSIRLTIEHVGRSPMEIN